MSFRPPSPHPRDHDPVSHGQLNDRLNYYVTGAELTRRLALIERHILAIEQNITIQGERQMASQADIDALTQALADEDAALLSAVAGIQAEIDALKQANPSLDLSALQAQVASTKDAVDAAAALVPPATA